MCKNKSKNTNEPKLFEQNMIKINKKNGWINWLIANKNKNCTFWAFKNIKCSTYSINIHGKNKAIKKNWHCVKAIKTNRIIKAVLITKVKNLIVRIIISIKSVYLIGIVYKVFGKRKDRAKAQISKSEMMRNANDYLIFWSLFDSIINQCIHLHWYYF